DAPDRERADDATDVLGRPVDGDFPPREALGHRESEGDSRVDVAARDLADRVDEGGDDEAEGEADRQEVRLGDRRHRLAGEREGRYDRPGTDQDQRRRAEHLGERPLWHRMHDSPTPYI